MDLADIIFNMCISIHALPRRATLDTGLRRGEIPHFNPRPPAEGDLLFSLIDTSLFIISIHALPRMATS